MDSFYLFLASRRKSLAPVANFSADTQTPPVGLVNFSDQSTNAPTSWLWEKQQTAPEPGGWVVFEGTPTAQNPTEIFMSGTWSIRLTATNAGGSDAETKTDYIVFV